MSFAQLIHQVFSNHEDERLEHAITETRRAADTLLQTASWFVEFKRADEKNRSVRPRA